MAGSGLGSETCESCGWESEKKWDSWDSERLRRMAEYLSGKGRRPRRTMEELDPGEKAPHEATQAGVDSEVGSDEETAP